MSFFSWLKNIFKTEQKSELEVNRSKAQKKKEKAVAVREKQRQKAITQQEADEKAEKQATVDATKASADIAKERKQTISTEDFIVKLRSDLERDEGIKYEIYLDHLGYPTFGIGHLVKPSDPEYGKPVGTPVSKERCYDAFREDIQISINDCRQLFADWDNLPEEVRLITANMAFNMGRNRLGKFQRTIAFIDNAKWIKAADEMVNSRWYRQVTNRAERLVKRMRTV